MKVWEATYHHDEDGRCVLWAETRKDLRRKILAERGSRGPLTLLDVRRTEVPRTRAALVSWLQVRLNRSNG